MVLLFFSLRVPSVPTASVGKSICFRIIAVVGIRQKPESRETRALNDGTRGLQYEYLMVGVGDGRPAVGAAAGGHHTVYRGIRRVFSR